MNINLNKTLKAIKKALAEKEPGTKELKRAYQETLRLQSQIFASAYDMEAFVGKAMIHSAIGEAARQGPLPHFRKAFVEIEITTSKGSDNARVWDTSNRAINMVNSSNRGVL